MPAEDSTVKIGAQGFRIADIRPEDEEDVLRLFSEAFGFCPPSGWYAWKYADGKGQAVGLWDEQGRLVAHFAGFPRKLYWCGKAVEGIQIGDVMVAPKMRGLMTRRGPFYQVCKHFFPGRVGENLPFRIAFGFPSERHLKLATALDLYHDAGVIYQISWPVRQQSLPPNWRWAPIDEKHLVSLTGPVWEAMRKDFADYVLGMRDPQYLRHRFLIRPDRTYRIYGLRRWPWRRTEAIAVMNLQPGRAELLDVVGTRALLGDVIRAATAEAAKAGAETMTAWASPAAAELLVKAGGSITGKAAHLGIPNASVLTAHEAAAAPWWWLGGDTDFL